MLEEYSSSQDDLFTKFVKKLALSFLRLFGESATFLSRPFLLLASRYSLTAIIKYILDQSQLLQKISCENDRWHIAKEKRKSRGNFAYK